MSQQFDHALECLSQVSIETPSWGFSDTGTRFGKFNQPGAAVTIWEKIADAATVHQLTGSCPKMAVHVLWDFPSDLSPKEVGERARAAGIEIGAINPNVFQDQLYKYGSVCSPWQEAKELASSHVLDSIQIAAETGSKDISLWFADGTNYPGQDSIVRRKRAMEEALQSWHGHLTPDMRLLVEYKPFEPAFYHTDVADWGMAYVFAKKAGPQAKVLVDTGHHLPGANIEHIVAFLVDEQMLGGFHFNDRKYADDDLTLGSIDPYMVFRIFHELMNAVTEDRLNLNELSFAVDQSHNLKPKVEAMVQTVAMAQELFLKAATVDREALRVAQKACDIVRAEELLRSAFFSDVSGPLQEFRRGRGASPDPIQGLRDSGYIQKIEHERGARNAERASGGSYA